MQEEIKSGCSKFEEVKQSEEDGKSRAKVIKYKGRDPNEID
jgi:hypothetical protein